MTRERHFVVVGAGPAGLTAAYELTRAGHEPVVVEKSGIVGGLARTEQYKGFHFDMGGHRFFTKAPEVEALWHEVLADAFLDRPRLSRIYYRKRFFHYPLKPLNALAGLGPVESVRIGFSYLRWQLFPHRREDTFEQWVTNRFGRRLFLVFFKTYTEKVWGISCSELKAEWAAQRIKDLSLRTALLNMFFTPRRAIKTLIERFEYPRLGPGMMWRAVADRVRARGGEVRLDTDVLRVLREGRCVTGLVVGANGHEQRVDGTDFISSMPVTELVRKLDPPAPDEVLAAADHLRYRDFLTVCLVVDRPDLFPDNWIYIHDDSVRVGRIQNFKNWSPHMVPDPAKTSLGLEYFCNEGDDLWSMSDADLVALGTREVAAIGLTRTDDVVDGCVFRMAKSYPVYDGEYAVHLDRIRGFVDSLENLQTVGRNGLHRYNNQDHAMLTGMYAVRNAIQGTRHDLWSVNTEAEYHEVARSQGRRSRMEDAGAESGLGLAGALYSLDRIAFGAGVGVVCGLGLLLMTLLLVLRGGSEVGPTLGLLAHYMPGYEVTLGGSLLGLFYGSTLGFLLGWTFSLVRNAVWFFYFAVVRRRAERGFLRDLMDYI